MMPQVQVKTPKSLFAAYLWEREQAHVIEYNWGFATYKIEADHGYLMDLYIVPEERQAGRGVQLEHEVITAVKEAGKSVLFGSVDLSSSFGAKMHKIMLKLGYQDAGRDGTLLYMKKDI